MTNEDRERAIKTFRYKIGDVLAYCGECKSMDEGAKEEIEAFNMAIKALEQQPCKGEWIRHTRVENVYDIKGVKTWGIKHQCNKCSFTTIAIEDFGYYDFCPHCGADMKKKGE